MKFAGRNNVGAAVCTALLMALTITTVHWSIMRNLMEVCYMLDAPGGRSQAYWDSGSGFNEKNNRIVQDSSKTGPARLCFSSSRMRNLTAIRIDPVDYAGKYWITDVEFAYLDVVIPFRFINRFNLSNRDAIVEGAVAIQNDDTGYESTGDDPRMTWLVPSKRVGDLSLFFLSFCVLGVVLTVCVFLAGRRTGSPGFPGSIFPLLLLYPLYLLFAVLSDAFGSFIRYADYALWLALGLAFIIAINRRVPRWSVSKSIATVVAIAIAFVITPDLAFRFGLDEKPAFMMGGNQVYHWRLSQPPDQNRRHSSMRYYNDINIMREALEPGAAFLSDLATSYYVSAATSLIATNAHMHHDREAARYRKVLDGICDAGRGESGQIIRDIAQNNRAANASNLSVIKYLIVNRDDINQNVVGNCLQRNHARIVREFGDRLRLVTTGEYIDSYELVFDP